MGWVYQSDIIKKYGLNRKDAFEFTDILIDVEPITVWRTDYKFNHWEEGHVGGIKPTPLDGQKSWLKQEWTKSFQYILWYKVKFNPIFPGRPVGKII